jgi:hypothetical protein
MPRFDGLDSRAVSQLLWSRKYRVEWSRPAGTTKAFFAFPDFLRAALTKVACAVPASRDRMQFGGPTKLHRKSGFGLHQLRNRTPACSALNVIWPRQPAVTHSLLLPRGLSTPFAWRASRISG